MKIIYLHQYFNTPTMTGGTRSYEMARRLVERGHEVHMVTSSRDDETPGQSSQGGPTHGWTETVEAGIQVHWCSVPYSNHMSYRRRIGAFAKFSQRAARKAASIRGDVVLATSTPLTIALPG
ncbi:MAG TPA: glycosyltransferase, partial [Thermoguttaceae bacterium]|nr:glycosyltransferase [Thermoguttaceae bacterium]